jgi:hypothetical protein
VHKIEVGQKYPLPTQQGTTLDYTESGFILTICLPQLTQREIVSYKSGGYRFELLEKENVMFLLHEFKPGCPLSDAPFNIAQYKDGREKHLPDSIPDGEGFGLQVTVVEQTTNVVKALRLIGLSTRFSNSLLDICKRQVANPISDDEYHASVNKVYNNYSSKQLARFSLASDKGK